MPDQGMENSATPQLSDMPERGSKVLWKWLFLFATAEQEDILAWFRK